MACSTRPGNAAGCGMGAISDLMQIPVAESGPCYSFEPGVEPSAIFLSAWCSPARGVRLRADVEEGRRMIVFHGGWRWSGRRKGALALREKT